MSIEIIEDGDLDDLTGEEIRIRAEAMEELDRGETINFQSVKHKWLNGKSPMRTH